MHPSITIACAQLNGSKYYYETLTIQFRHTVKEFQKQPNIYIYIYIYIYII